MSGLNLAALGTVLGLAVLPLVPPTTSAAEAAQRSVRPAAVLPYDRTSPRYTWPYERNYSPGACINGYRVVHEVRSRGRTLSGLLMPCREREESGVPFATPE